MQLIVLLNQHAAPTLRRCGPLAVEGGDSHLPEAGSKLSRLVIRHFPVTSRLTHIVAHSYSVHIQNIIFLYLPPLYFTNQLLKPGGEIQTQTQGKQCFVTETINKTFSG